MWNAITYELSYTRYETTRTVYNFFDLLGELGGLFSALFTFGSIFITVFQFRGAYMFVMSTMTADEDWAKTNKDTNNWRKYYT